MKILYAVSDRGMVMKILAACFIGLISFVGITVLSILGLIYGWGLEPQSWKWIIGSYLGAVCISLFCSALKVIVDEN